MKINPYLAFDGRCREAFDFYQKTMGGQISFIQTMGESPMASSIPPDAHGRVMHVTLQIGDQVLQGADAPPVQMPFQATYWARGFGMLIDQFDTPWIVNTGQATGN